MHNDLISRSKLKKTINDFYDSHFIGIVANELITYANAVDTAIDIAPTVEVDKEFIDKIRATGNFKNGYQLAKNYYKRPQGEWIKISAKAFKCKDCNYVTDIEYPYCPICGNKMVNDEFGNCGADMRGEKNETDN